ncbi:response regulator [Natronosalvus rutilus]|uniref:Response regulator n=1 Tax=Natronosalvus rutilus TaxID=2953753 RepID=A0A9E7NF82_9EURY|nr:response regulator [Natronosalvus rutilus]UTF55910.1 response regulator [Natronosalvus rutilus]
MNSDNSPVVLIVEDEPDVAETYKRWLRSEYDVRVAASGSEALDQLDGTVDVVLLDRMMPEMSGSEVLEEIRNQGIDCRVAMVTAVDPDFDIIEMGFDEYVTKPPDRDELEATVERLLERASLDDALQEYYSLVARRSALQAEKSTGELASNDEYDELINKIDTMRETVDASLGDMASNTDFVGAVREIMGDEELSTGDTETKENQE